MSKTFLRWSLIAWGLIWANTITAYADPLIFNLGALPNAMVGQPYSVALGTLNGVAPVTFSISIGTITPGLSLSPSGLVSGTPTATGSWDFNITATDSIGQTATHPYQIDSYGPALTIQPGTIPNGAAGQGYSVTFSASGGRPPYSYYLSLSNVPGIALDPMTGVYAGTPSTSGTYTIRVEAADSAASFGSQVYTLTIDGNNSLTLSPASLSDGIVGTLYSQTIFATAIGLSITPPIQWGISSGSLPPGLALQTTLPDRTDIRGTPSAPGTHSFHLTARDGAGRSAGWDYSIAIAAPPITVNPGSVPQGTMSLPYTVTFSATGGVPPYTFSGSDYGGPFGVGVFVASNGLLHFTPAASGTAGFRVEATDSTGAKGTRDYSLTILPATLSVSPLSLPNATIHQTYSAQITASGGTAPYTFSVSTGATPNGLGLSGNGVLSGSPQQAGNFSFSITARDANGATGTTNYSLTINGATITLAAASLPDAISNQPYSGRITASGGTPPYTFTMPVAELWTVGINLNSDGTITGTPTSTFPALLKFTVQATDANGSTGSQQFQMNLKTSAVTVNISPATLPNATVGSPYTMNFTATGGQPPYFFSTSGLPSGIALSSAGTLSGTPTAPGTYSVHVQATDANSASGSANYTLVVSAGPLTLAATVIPAIQEGTAYSTVFQGSGGTPPYTFSVTAGGLPSGLTLGSSGNLTGTPTQHGTFAFTVTIRDSAGATNSAQVEVTVNPRVVSITISPSSLPSGVIGGAYSALLSASGGDGPYSFSLNSGALPPGLSLSSSGTLSGTPTSSATYSFTVQARDTNGIIGTQAYVLAIAGGTPLSIVATPIPNGSQNSSFTWSLQASGGRAPYSWKTSGGTLPPGMTLLTDGVLAGTPTASGQFQFTVTVTDRDSQTAASPLLLNVTPAPEVNAVVFDPAQVSLTVPQKALSQQQCIAVFSTKVTAAVTASLAGSSSSWASINSTSLTTPGSVCVKIDPANLQPGTYSNSLQLTSANAQPQVVSVPITLTIQPDSSANLRVVPTKVSSTVSRAPLNSSSGRFVDSFLIANDGSAPLSFTVSADPVGWIMNGSGSGIVPGGQTIPFSLQLDPSGLEPGVYSAKVYVTGAGAEQTIQLELIVTDADGQFSLSESSLELVTWSGGAAVSAVVGIANQGAVDLLPTITAHTTDGTAWLKLSLDATDIASGSAAPIHISADPSALAPGHYTGWLTAQAAAAINGPQVTTVGLTVLAAGDRLPASSAPEGVVLIPGSLQGNIVVATAPRTGLSFNTTISGTEAGWLKVNPQGGAVPSTGSLNLSVTADVTGRQPGLYHATVGVGFSDGIVRSIPVDLYVPVSGSSAGQLRPLGITAECAPIIAHLLTPTPNFVAQTNLPTPVRVRVENCDGSPAFPAQAIMHSGTQNVALVQESPGLWSGTWIPSTPNANAIVEVTVTEFKVSGPTTVTLQSTGAVTAGSNAGPMITSVVPATTLVADSPLGANGWITIRGQGLADAPLTASTATLPTSLADIEILLGGIAVPLYYVSPTQVNAVLPQSLAADSTHQLFARRRGIPAIPLSVTVADVSPGLFTINSQGNGQAAALLSGTSTLAAPGSPVARGGTVELYGSGMGSVANGPADGVPASLTSLSSTDLPVTATVGGRPAQVLFAGLTPSAISLDVVVIQIPEDAPVGDAVEVVVMQKDVRSNAATIAIK